MRIAQLTYFLISYLCWIVFSCD